MRSSDTKIKNAYHNWINGNFKDAAARIKRMNKLEILNASQLLVGDDTVLIFSQSNIDDVLVKWRMFMDRALNGFYDE